MDPGLFPDDETSIEVIQSKENKEGVTEYQVKYTKYFWLKEGELHGYKDLVEEFLRKKKQKTKNSQPTDNTNKKKKTLNKTLLSQYEESDNDIYAFLVSDTEDEGDKTNDDEEWLPHGKSSGKRKKRAPRKREIPAKTRKSVSSTTILVTSNISEITQTGKSKKRKNSSPVKISTNTVTYKSSFGGTEDNCNNAPDDYKPNESLKSSSDASTTVSSSGITKTSTPTSSVQRFPCSQCARQYLRMSELRKHMRTHSGTNEYHCKLCDLHCLKPSKLKRHLMTRNHARQVALNLVAVERTCQVCLTEHEDSNALREHIETVHRINPDELDTTMINLTANSTENLNGSVVSFKDSSITPSDPNLNSSKNGDPVVQGTNNTDSNINLSLTEKSQEHSSEDTTGRTGEHKTQEDGGESSNTTTTTNEAKVVTAKTESTATNNEGSNDNPNVNCKIVKDPLTGKQRYQCKQCKKSLVSRKMFRMHLRIHNGTNPYYCPACKRYCLKRNELSKHLSSKKHLDRIAQCIKEGIPVKDVDLSTISAPKNKLTIVCAGPDMSFPCSICPKKFLTENSRKLHEKVHLGESSHVCSICNRQFTKKIHLQYHKMSVHSDTDGQFKCDICSAAFRLPSELNKHKLIHPNSRICKTCQKAFDSASLLIEHLKESTDCIGYKCAVCECIFMDQKGYDKHIVRHNEQHMTEVPDEETGGVKYSCTHCEKTFSLRKSCREHLSIHLGTSRHYCDTCNKYFGKKTHLIAHQASVHSQHPSFQCDSCLATFKHAYNLKLHKLTHIDGRRCKTCDEEFESVSQLREHLKESEKCTSYKCDPCDLVFVEKRKYRSHMKMKHGPGDLRRRVNAHGNMDKFNTPKTHACQQCSETFALTTMLRQHMEWHKNGRYPNQCNVCDRVFFSKWKVERHITTVHMGLRQYECSICDKDFKSKASLKLHVMKCHDHSTVKCPDCSKEFMTATGMEQHQVKYCPKTKSQATPTTTASSETNSSLPSLFSSFPASNVYGLNSNTTDEEALISTADDSLNLSTSLSLPTIATAKAKLIAVSAESGETLTIPVMEELSFNNTAVTSTSTTTEVLHTSEKSDVAENSTLLSASTLPPLIASTPAISKAISPDNTSHFMVKNIVYGPSATMISSENVGSTGRKLQQQQLLINSNVPSITSFLYNEQQQEQQDQQQQQQQQQQERHNQQQQQQQQQRHQRQHSYNSTVTSTIFQKQPSVSATTIPFVRNIQQNSYQSPPPTSMWVSGPPTLSSSTNEADNKLAGLAPASKAYHSNDVINSSTSRLHYNNDSLNTSSGAYKNRLNTPLSNLQQQHERRLQQAYTTEFPQRRSAESESDRNLVTQLILQNQYFQGGYEK